METTQEVLNLMAELSSVKDEIKTLREKSRKIEEMIADIVNVSDEQSISISFDTHKLGVSKLSKKELDKEFLPQVKELMLKEFPSVKLPIRTKEELDVRAWKNMAVQNNKAFDVFSNAVTTKPGSVSVRIEEI